MICKVIPGLLLLSVLVNGLIYFSPFSKTSNLLFTNKKYPLSLPHYNKKMNESGPPLDMNKLLDKKYPLSIRYYEKYMRRLNSKDPSIQQNTILGRNEDDEDEDIDGDIFEKNLLDLFRNNTERPRSNRNPGGVRIIINKGSLNAISADFFNRQNQYDGNEGEDEDDDGSNYFKNKHKKSENFEVLTKFSMKFKDVGGYDKIKDELRQCIDILSNYTKYSKYNVRIPKGLILEGPPGNGKTMLAKALAGEAKVGFIAVSGSEFQEKYVGVGSSRVRELFQLAKKNVPCIIFIDEIDAIGRARSGDGETSSSERDNTLNELLVAMDGFKNSSGIFLIGATNRIDLLDPALMRPGRVDKKIYIGNPDSKTREAILTIHSKGKPYDQTVNISDLVDLTMGLSGAQIENLLNEAMLNALRYNRAEMTMDDIDSIINRMLAGWQPEDHQFTADIVDHIAIHEMGHAVTGALSKHHSKVTKVIINLSSPKSPGYTVFEGSTSSIYTREALFEHLVILLGGRIAEEVFYGVSVTTGAINDFEEAFKLAEKMVIYYGMGKKVIYPSNSDKYKELIDDDVAELIQEAYRCSETIIKESKDILLRGAEILKKEKILKAEQLLELFLI
jgi:cell division protease FtsH